MKAEHTPTPWTNNRGVIKHHSGTGAPGLHVAHIGTSHKNTADARFIVQACNSHEKLVAACKAVRQCLEIMDNGAGSIKSGCVYKQLEKAIAAAKKG